MNLPEDKLSFAPSYLQCNANTAQLWQVNNTQVQYWLFLLPLRLVSCPLAWCCRHNVPISLKEVPQTKKIGKVVDHGTKEKSFQLKPRRMAWEHSVFRFHGVSKVRSPDFNARPRSFSTFLIFHKLDLVGEIQSRGGLFISCSLPSWARGSASWRVASDSSWMWRMNEGSHAQDVYLSPVSGARTPSPAGTWRSSVPSGAGGKNKRFKYCQWW